MLRSGSQRVHEFPLPGVVERLCCLFERKLGEFDADSSFGYLR